MVGKIVFSLAVLVGAISVLPYIVAYVLISPEGGEKLGYFYHDSELVYLSRIREVTEGNIHISSPAFAEYKNTPHIQQPFSEWTYAIASLGVPEYVPAIGMVFKFLFPTALFLFVYLVVRELLSLHVTHIRSRYLAMCISVLVLLGYDLNNSGFLHQLFSGSFSAPVLSLWTRLVHPITGALGLFGMSYIVLTSDRKGTYGTISAGLLLGLLSGYIFSYALGMVLVGIMLCFALVEKNYMRAKKLSSIILISLLINIFYIYETLTASSNIAMLEKNGLLLTHQILHNKVLYIATIVFVFWTSVLYTQRKAKGVFWKHIGWQWSASALLASFICLNQQVLTGKTVWPGHFVQYTNPIGFIIFFTCTAFLLESFIERKSVYIRNVFDIVSRYGCVLTIVGIFVIQIVTVQSVFTNQKEYQNIQRYEPLLAWLTENEDRSCVVFVAEERERLEKYITAYTPCNLYQSSFVFYGVPDERVLHNYLVHLRLLGVAKEDVEAYLDAHEGDLREYFFEDWADKFGDGRDTWLFKTKPFDERMSFIPRTKERIRTAYESIENQSLEALLTKYSIQYIIYDNTYETPVYDTKIYPKVYDSNGLVILQVQ
jgi:hypothetical protein